MPDPRTVCQVKANGRIYTAWKSITVRRAYGDTVSWFQMNCSEGGSLGGSDDARRLVPGTPVQITLGGVVALVGAVTTRSATYDAGSHEVIIGGRSGTGDAADSTVNVTPGNLNGYTAEQIARGALQPHGIDLNVVNPPATFTKPFPFFAVNPGETVMQHIERAMRMRGGLHVGRRAGPAMRRSGRSECRGGRRTGGGAQHPASHLQARRPGHLRRAVVLRSAAGAKATIWRSAPAQATVQNPTVRQNRTRVEHAEHPGDAEDMSTRANLEAARSAWPTVEASVTVAGWIRPDGKLWGLMDNVSVYSTMGLPNGTGKMTLGVQAITYNQVKDAEGEGTTTTLELKRPELLTSTPHSDVQSDGSGGYGDGSGSPAPASQATPDYQGSAATGPGGQLGHV